MAKHDKQQTQPRGKDEHGEPHKPVEIPVPKRKQVEQFMRDVASDSKPTK